MPLDLNQFVQVARHPDENRVVVLDARKVLARSERDLGPHFDGRAVTAEFRESARAGFGMSAAEAERLRYLQQNGQPLRVRDVSRVLADSQVSRSTSSGSAHTEAKPLQVVLVGGGPRSSLQVCAEIDLLMRPDIQSHIKEIMALGGRYDIRTIIVEKQGRDSIGAGVAWNKDQEGTANNTGADYPACAPRVKRLYLGKREELLASVEDSPPGRAFLQSAFSGGREPTGTGSDSEPRTDRAATLRKHFGREEHAHFEARLQAAREDELLRDIYKVEVLADTEAVGVDTSSPLRPSVSIKGAAHGSIDADLVRLNTGTTMGSPLTEAQSEVMKHSYIGPMNQDGFTAFLRERNLLDENGRLKPGTRVLTGGTGLSLYDQLLVLDRVMGLTEVDGSPLGYRVSEAAKGKHQGAILITSRTDGKWVAPRHAETPGWGQDLDPVANAREQHALFLHNQGEEVFKSWEDICIASVAATTGRTPAQVRHDGMTTKEVLDLQTEETRKHLDGPADGRDKTLYSALRQAHLSSFLGLGLERDLKQASKALGEAAPLTHSGRAGLLMLRAQVNAVTNPDSPVSRTNKPIIDVVQFRMRNLASSPVQIHALAHELIDAGIAAYTPGSYESIKIDESGKRLNFVDARGNPSTHDIFVVSPVFKRESNPAEMSLAGQVDPIDAETPSAGRMGFNRMLLRDDGVPLNVESYGLGAAGVRRGDGSTAGKYAFDLTHKASGKQVGGGLAYRRMAEQHLATAGRLDPIGDVEAMYREVYAGKEEAYRAEVEKFRGDYEEVMQKAAFLRCAERSAAGPEEYRALYEAAREPEQRRELGGEAYQRELERIPEFNPAGSDAYFSRFVDFPESVHQQVYERAVREARESLTARNRLVA